MNSRPHREDIPEDVQPADVLYEVRLLWYELSKFRAEVNGNLTWLQSFRSKVRSASRFLLVVTPALLAAAIAFYLAQ